jgi:NADPH-dependent 2,4-dienoyl-CoA reductase/sulfur reductase-like enzyme/peroxiredoxin family protein/rhodanese-related sulfurtransferase/TusA-related sulfurtransferase
MPSPTKLLIIGGVAGGATAAARARRLNENAEIIVFERGPYVSFANCGLPYHIGDVIEARDKLLLQTPAALNERYRLDVRVNAEVLAIDRDHKRVTVRDHLADRTYTESYDKIILSPGASPIRPPLPGIDHPKLRTLRNVPDTEDVKRLVDDGARSALIVGGGFIGLEMAENLRHRGLDVTLVEREDHVLPPFDPEMAAPLHDTLHANSVNLILNDAVAAFDDDSGRVKATLASGLHVTTDFVILSVGVRPDSELAAGAGLEVNERGGIVVNERMQTSDPDIYAVGDAVVVKDFVTGADTMIPLAGPANRQARIAADNVFGRNSIYRGTQGTAIVKVFAAVAAQTGAGRRALDRAGVDYECVYIHPANHVGYYPGGNPMTIKLLFAKDTGRALGAQIVGTDGVDKRIDVLATAIQAGFTVFDLERLELAYAPQFGAAKDPINVAGFVAGNALRGDMPIAHTEDLDGAFVLDVRQPAEFEAGAVPGAASIPLPELRERLAEVPKDRRVITCCHVGLRSYLATRILAQHGYDVANLTGGYKTYKMTAASAGRTPAAPAPTHGGLSAEPVPAGVSGADISRADISAAYISPRKVSNRPESEPNATASGPATTCCGSAAEGCETPAVATAAPDSATTEHLLDVRGRQCPGPIVAVSQAIKELSDGQTLRVLASDPGFPADLPAWCRTTGTTLLDVTRDNGHYVAVLRKGSAVQAASAGRAGGSAATGKTIVVFSGDLDRVMAAFVIANGAAAMGHKVTLFFTFWGLNALRKAKPPAVRKSFLDRMFGWMMPRGADKLALSKMNMGGLGTRMMKYVMKSKHVSSLPELMAAAREAGVTIVACTMSMDVMGITKEELIDGIEYGGVGMYLGAANESNVNLFV